MPDYNDTGLTDEDILKVYGGMAGQQIQAGLEAVKPILRTQQPTGFAGAYGQAPGDEPPTSPSMRPESVEQPAAQPPAAPAAPPHRMDIWNGRNRDTFDFGADGSTTRVGESSGYALLPSEEKQVNDIDQAMRNVQGRDDLDAAGKQHVVQELQRKRNALDPQHQYGANSARGKMTAAAKWAAQNVYTHPETGVMFYSDGKGGWKHVEPKHMERIHEAATAAREHQHKERLAQIQASQEFKEKESQWKQEKAKLDMAVKASQGEEARRGKRQDQFLKFYDAAHKHLTTKDELKNDVPPKPEAVDEYVRKAMELHAELSGDSLPEDWKGSKEYTAKQEEKKATVQAQGDFAGLTQKYGPNIHLASPEDLDKIEAFASDPEKIGLDPGKAKAIKELVKRVREQRKMARPAAPAAPAQETPKPSGRRWWLPMSW